MPKLPQFTDRALTALAAPARYRDPMTRGLYLQVTGPSAKSWILRFTVAGRSREQGLGGFPGMPVAKARQLAAQARFDIEQGIDPLAVRQAQYQEKQHEQLRRLTFRQAALSFVEGKQEEWRNAKHRQQWKNTLEKYAFPAIGHLPVSDISRKHLLDLLQPIWSQKPETARRVRQRIETVLDSATALGARTGDNPARWKEGLKFLLPSLSRKDKVQHHVALPVVAMPEFYLKLTKFEAVSALALRFTILTASRTGEVIGARWDELEKGDVWIVPAARMKGGKEHRVPLSQHTQELLACLAAIRRDEFVFPGLKRGNPISNMAMLTFLKKSMKVPITTHGFRSSFRDWGHELGKNCDHMEQCLAHRLGDETTEAYLRSTAFAARKKIMNDWAAFLIGVGANPLTPERRAKIVQKASEWSLR